MAVYTAITVGRVGLSDPRNEPSGLLARDGADGRVSYSHDHRKRGSDTRVSAAVEALATWGAAGTAAGYPLAPVASSRPSALRVHQRTPAQTTLRTSAGDDALCARTPPRRRDRTGDPLRYGSPPVPAPTTEHRGTAACS